LLGTAAANLDRDAVSKYLALLFDQTGHVRCAWEAGCVLERRAASLMLRERGESIQRRLELVSGGRPSTWEAFLVCQLGPVVGVRHAQ